MRHVCEGEWSSLQMIAWFLSPLQVFQLKLPMLWNRQALLTLLLLNSWCTEFTSEINGCLMPLNQRMIGFTFLVPRTPSFTRPIFLFLALLGCTEWCWSCQWRCDKTSGVMPLDTLVVYFYPASFLLIFFRAIVKKADSETTLLRILTLPHTDCVTRDMIFKPSVPQLSHLYGIGTIVILIKEGCWNDSMS